MVQKTRFRNKDRKITSDRGLLKFGPRLIKGAGPVLKAMQR